MTKQTKLIKTMLLILILIPVILFSVAIVQTFVLKSKQNELTIAQRELSASKENYQTCTEIQNYQQTDEYKIEYYKNGTFNEENYSNNPDDKNIKIEFN